MASEHKEIYSEAYEDFSAILPPSDDSNDRQIPQGIRGYILSSTEYQELRIVEGDSPDEENPRKEELSCFLEEVGSEICTTE